MQIKKVEEKYKTKWVVCKQVTYVNKEGKDATWDYISRVNDTPVVTIVCRDTKKKQYLILRQFRVPLGKYVLEFPAGLIDPNETPQTAALRELKEETGYDGKIISVSPKACKSPGLSDEFTTIVVVEVKSGKKVIPNQDTSEEIETIWIDPKNFEKLLKQPKYQNDAVDALLWTYLIGLRK